MIVGLKEATIITLSLSGQLMTLRKYLADATSQSLLLNRCIESRELLISGNFDRSVYELVANVSMCSLKGVVYHIYLDVSNMEDPLK